MCEVAADSGWFDIAWVLLHRPHTLITLVTHCLLSVAVCVVLQFDDEEAEEEGDVGEVMDTDDDADEEELDAAGRTLQGTNADMQDGDDGGAHLGSGLC